MKPEVLAFLVCPECESDLTCAATERDGAEILSGNLSCSGCSAEYPIVRGVPRFITTESPLSGKHPETAAAFGWEWQRFSRLHDLATYEWQFRDWIHPLEPSVFRGKVVLDAGCGMGRFSVVSARFGAEAVLAVDASDSVEAARENAREESRVHVIQADIHRLPLRRDERAQMDIIVSIGVLHHLDDPKAGFAALARHLGPLGVISVWVYGREGNRWILDLVDPVRIRVTSRMSRRSLYVLSWLIAAGIQPTIRLLYEPMNRSPGLRRVARRALPYNDYLAWLGRFGFRHTHHVVFDHLVAPVAHYVGREELATWFSEAGMELLGLSWRNRNSWRGHGQLPVRVEGEEPHR